MSKTMTKTDNDTAAIATEKQPAALTLDDLKREKARYEVAYQQLLDNANANAGVIQFLTMQIERLENETKENKHEYGKQQTTIFNHAK